MIITEITEASMRAGSNAQIGMSRDDGSQLGRRSHIAQSVQDILTTTIGSRIHRRDYGSYLYDLMASAMNDAGRLRLMAALVDAIDRWEPRVAITNAQVQVDKEGRTTLDYDYREVQPSGELSAQAVSGLAMLDGAPSRI